MAQDGSQSTFEVAEAERFGTVRAVVGPEILHRHLPPGPQAPACAGIAAATAGHEASTKTTPTRIARARPVRLALGVDESDAVALLAHADLLVTSPSVSSRFPTTDPWLREALATCANQTYPNVEVVVVEDGPERSRAVDRGTPVVRVDEIEDRHGEQLPGVVAEDGAERRVHAEQAPRVVDEHHPLLHSIEDRAQEVALGATTLGVALGGIAVAVPGAAGVVRPP